MSNSTRSLCTCHKIWECRVLRGLFPPFLLDQNDTVEGRFQEKGRLRALHEATIVSNLEDRVAEQAELIRVLSLQVFA